MLHKYIYIQYIYIYTSLASAERPSCCTWLLPCARHLTGKMIIYGSFAHHDTHSPEYEYVLHNLIYYQTDKT